MQHASAITCPAHARIGNTHHVAHALFEQLLRNRQHAPLRHAGTAQRTGVAQHQHRASIHIEIRVVEPRGHVVVIVEHHCATGVLQQLRVGCGRLDNGSVRREIATQHDQPTVRLHGIVGRANHIGVMDFGACDILPERLSGARQFTRVEQIAHALQQAGQPAGVIKILHQVFARRTHVHQIGCALADFFEALQRNLDTGAAGHGDYMNQSVRGTAQRHQHLDRIVEGLPGQDIARLEIFPDHFHDTPAREIGHAAVIGIDRRNRRRIGKTEPERLRNTRHRRSRAHGHAGSG